MRRGLALGLLLGWLLGVATGLLGVAVTGGWYEYRLATTSDAIRLVNAEKWQVVQSLPRNPNMGLPEDQVHLRRPRLRLP